MIKLQTMKACAQLALLATALALAAGCVSVPTGQVLQEAGPRPTREQAEAAIHAHLQRALRDPASLKDFAVLSGPELVTGTNAGQNFEKAWLVCVEYNAKNAYGGYTGIQSEGYPLRFSGADLVIISRINWIGADRGC